jgi:ribosomal protein S18 acetylase RimI-like enzyme
MRREARSQMNDTAGVALAEISDPNDPRLTALIALYEASIPERERKPVAAVAAMTRSPVHRVLVACDDDAVIGFLLLYVGAGLALLEYLATAEHVRGQGLGGFLYRQARAAAGARPLIVEVESDREPGPDRALRARRIAFYRRLGCRRARDFDFILPLEGVGPPPLLDLLIDGARNEAIAPLTFAGWLTEIYVGVYGCAPDDPRLEHMIGSLPAANTLD